MGYSLGVTTLGSTGLKSINLGASSTPYAAAFVVQNKTATAESTKHVSIGTADVNGQRCTSYVKPSGGSFTVFNSITKVISHYEVIGGVVTEVLSAEFDSFTATGVKINVTIANSNYDVYVRADY